MQQDKPIGWWVKHLDRALEDAFAGALAGEGVDRRQWQLLTVAASSATVAALAPFFTDAAEADVPVRKLVERGWLLVDGGTLTLTTDGAAARDRLTVTVQGQRARALEGIEPGEYTATIDVLRRMAANLTPPVAGRPR